jgi:DNA-binding response OmpR family regulator
MKKPAKLQLGGGICWLVMPVKNHIGGSPVPAKTPDIVVIDDNLTSIHLYQLSTKSLDVDLRSFQSASKSLEYLQDHSADLLFLDVLVREKDGLTLLKKLRGMKHHQNTVVVMVTSKDYHQDRHIARSLGVREYLVKPLRSQEIREIICKYTDAQPDSGHQA